MATSSSVLLGSLGLAWLLSAALLWLGGTLASTGRSCAWPLSGGLLSASTAASTCALWVPVALLTTIAGTEPSGLNLAASALLSVTIAALVTLAGWWLKRKMTTAAVTMLPLLTVESSVFFWVTTPWSVPTSVALGAVTVASLLTLHVPQVLRWRFHKSLRFSGALAAAACLVGAPPLAWMLDAPSGLGNLNSALPASTTFIALMVMTLMTALATALYGVMQTVPLRELGLAYDSHRKPLFSDALTQLPTRNFLEKRMHAVARKCDERKTRMALLFIDLDGFKPVNDTFGHGHGDAVLQQVGKRLRLLARSGHVVARVGGDEFMLLMSNIESSEDVAQLARRLIKHLSQPYQVEQQELGISCSVGIAIYPDAGGISKLIARADAAMYAAKRSGGACYCFYTPAMDADAKESFELLRGLREAVELKQFELYYQPKVDAKSGKITAAEALIRWQHPTRGLILPGIFIPIAERFGLMGALGDWVIEDVCRQARQWRDQGLHMRVAINLSAMQLRQDDIARRIGDALHRHRIDPACLTCEITESAAMEDTRTTQETLRHLGELGVHISIDDFGTGYSSLSYLRQLPAEELKIDRSFIVDIDGSPDARAVVDAVVKLAHALGLKVVAEGVENRRQQDVLVALGCDELQGYLYARPMTASALLISSQSTHPERVNFRSSLFGVMETRETI